MINTNRIFKNKKSGVTLVEILISLLVLALAILPAVGTFSSYYGSASKQLEQEMALKIAEATVNLLNSVSFKSYVDGTITAEPLSLDIQTPNGTFNGKLYFKAGIPNMPEEHGYIGTTSDKENEKLLINRVEYKINVIAKRIFQGQNISAPHEKAMKLFYLSLEKDETSEKDPIPTKERYECFDDMYIFDIEVSFGKTFPIRITSFRTDMVK